MEKLKIICCELPRGCEVAVSQMCALQFPSFFCSPLHNLIKNIVEDVLSSQDKGQILLTCALSTYE